MGFLGNLFKKSIEAQVRSFARGLCNAMLISALAAKEKYPDKKNYSEYAVMALETRPLWKKLLDSKFEYKHGGSVRIEQKDSLLDVIHRVAGVEMAHITSTLSVADKVLLEREVYREIESFFKKKER